MSESAWLIERWYGDTLCYWNAGNCGSDYADDPRYYDGFTANISKAVRLARRADAEVILYRILRGKGRVVEHMWADAAKGETADE